MRTILFTILAFCAVTLTAQNSITINGKIINEEGKAVEYATIGIPGTAYGALSGIDGCFSLTLPQECRDTLVASHVSYGDTKIPSIVYMNGGDTLTVTMHSRQLDELVVYNGKRKKGKLMGKGMRVPGAATSWSIGSLGYEVGSIIEVEQTFEVDEIRFRTLHNTIEHARLSVNIYSMDESNGIFSNILHRPIYIDIPAENEKREHTTAPNERVFLAPGSYFVAVKLVDGKSDSLRNKNILFPLYLKSSYIRKGAADTLEKIPVNLGLQITGDFYK